MKKKVCSVCQEERYCSKCGNRLVVREEIHTEYDSRTGERVDLHYHHWKCPNAGGVLDFFIGHANYDDVPTWVE